MTNFITKAVCAASLLTLAIAPAAAEPLMLEVDYSDLDIASPTGAEKLAQRVQAQIDSACEKPFIRALKAVRGYQKCRSSALQAVTETLSQKGVNTVS